MICRMDFDMFFGILSEDFVRTLVVAWLVLLKT